MRAALFLIGGDKVSKITVTEFCKAAARGLVSPSETYKARKYEYTISDVYTKKGGTQLAIVRRLINGESDSWWWFSWIDGSRKWGRYM